jgi:Zn-dependent M16 (insulinase) family peptidase
VIPQLTFEQFQDFHARYYHPSNGRFWFYGDDDATKRLQILDAYLRWACVLSNRLLELQRMAPSQLVCLMRV